MSMISKKGGNLHKKSGRLFYYSMWLVSLTALALSLIKDSSFLLHVGLFVLYQNYSAWKAVQVKSLKADSLDIINSIFAALNGIWMIMSGQVVLLFFGGITSLLIFQDAQRIYKLRTGKPLGTKAWLEKHIGHTIGAYIGTITAFLVVNIPPLQPVWLIWVLPTFILVPLMRYWTWKYTRKKNTGVPSLN